MNKLAFLNKLNEYLSERFNYRTPPAKLETGGNVISTNRVKCDIRIRFVERNAEGWIWKAGTCVIARLGFQEERRGHGTDFLQFITPLLKHYGFKYIGLEETNVASRAFAKKWGFVSCSEKDYIIEIEKLSFLVNKIRTKYIVSDLNTTT